MNQRLAEAMSCELSESVVEHAGKLCLLLVLRICGLRTYGLRTYGLRGKTFARLPRKMPQRLKLIRLQFQPAIRNASIVVKQIKCEIAEVTKPRQHSLALGEQGGGAKRVHTTPPMRIE
jgi:hypothetical protein